MFLPEKNCVYVFNGFMHKTCNEINKGPFRKDGKNNLHRNPNFMNSPYLSHKTTKPSKLKTKIKN